MEAGRAVPSLETTGRRARELHHSALGGFAALFTDDGRFALGDDGAQGRAAIRDFMMGIMKSPGGAHIITNVSVRPAGKDRWSAVADYLLTRRADDDGPWGIVGVGWYESVATWVGGEWYFAEHRIVPR